MNQFELSIDIWNIKHSFDVYTGIHKFRLWLLQMFNLSVKRSQIKFRNKAQI
jgi:hypothetical protein